VGSRQWRRGAAGGRLGRRGRKTAGRPAATALVALAALVVAGCSMTGTAGTGSGAGSGAGRAVPESPAAAASGPLRFCAVTSTEFVATALGRMMPGSDTAEVVPLGASASGRVAYVSAWTPRFAGVAALDLGSGQLRMVQPFANPASDQADGASSGNWLVWAETYSLTSLDRFAIYAWNAATGRTRRIGHSLAAPGGTAWPSPWHAPAVSGNYAAWAQGYGPGGLVEIRLADLVTGKVTTIARGHVQPPFFDRGLVVWPESDRPGSQTTLRGYSLAAGAMTGLPPVLAGVRGTDFVVTDGRRTAYLSPGFTRLYYSPAQDVAARPVLTLPVGTDFTDLALAPGSMAWTTTRATYLASTRTGAFARVTPHYGYPTGSGSVMLITDPPSEKAAHPPLPTHIVDPAAISWPACPAHSS
jgi:hypothetical protein